MSRSEMDKFGASINLHGFKFSSGRADVTKSQIVFTLPVKAPLPCWYYNKNSVSKEHRNKLG